MIEVAEIREKFDELSRPTLESGRFLELATFTQHGTTTTLDHVVAVAYASLHDYYLYDWHDHSAAPDKWHGFTHPRHALNNALVDFPDLSPIERDIILHHMFPLVPFPPRSKEAWIVSLCDKLCSSAETCLGNPYVRSAR